MKSRAVRRWKTWRGPMQRVKLSVMLCLVSAIPLASCQTPGADECRIFQPIVASDADTRETKNQAAVHNEKGVAGCGWKAPEVKV